MERGWSVERAVGKSESYLRAMARQSPHQPHRSLQFHHGLPRSGVVDEKGTAQLLVRIVHQQVLGGHLSLKVGVVGFPKQRRGRG